MASVRKNQKNLAPNEWSAFIAAINALHGTNAAPPAYRAFVQVHVDAMSMAGMPWGVHTMPQMGMVGRNFLAWHRRFLLEFEQRLQKVDMNVAVPYWDWIADPVIPAQLDAPALLQSWSVVRQWDPASMPTKSELDAVMARTKFPQFQRRLELGPHSDVHVAVGGTMDSSSSPADPVFWLHHANIDRLWARWEGQHAGAQPPNPNEVLQPPPLFGVAVSTVLNIAALGYSYA